MLSLSLFTQSEFYNHNSLKSLHFVQEYISGLNILKLRDRDMVARLAQSVEHETLNLRVVGSSPTLGANFWLRQFFATMGVPRRRGLVG